MIAMNQKQLNAAIRLSNDEDFGVFMEWVKSSFINEAIMSNNIGREPERSWMQGRVQQLGYLRDAVDKARETLAAMEASGKGV